MNVSWVLFIALRYFRAKRKSRGLGPSILSVIGIAVGVMTLISVMGVMNGFQLGFIDDILEIRSYHLRIEQAPTLSPTTESAIRALKGVKTVLPFIETQVLLKSDYSGFEGVMVRGIPENTWELDPSLVDQLGLDADSFDLSGAGSMVIGFELAHLLGVKAGDTVSSLSLAGGSFSAMRPEAFDFTITGVFKSGYYEFDRNMAFISLNDAQAISNDAVVYGIKLDNRYGDRAGAAAVAAVLKDTGDGGTDPAIISWRTYNSSFFGALRMEKLAMMILVGLIFIVVGANIYHALKRTVVERAEEIGILKSLGASSRGVQTVFLVDGIFIGFSGGFIGLLAGLFISANINQVFALAEFLINLVIRTGGRIFMPFMERGSEGFSIFSSSYYYITDIPSRLLFPEVLLIFVFAFLSSSGAALFASRSVASVKPADVLRFEQK